MDASTPHQPRPRTPAQILRDEIDSTTGDQQAALIRAAAARRDFPLSWIPRHLLFSMPIFSREQG